MSMARQSIAKAQEDLLNAERVRGAVKTVLPEDVLHGET